MVMRRSREIEIEGVSDVLPNWQPPFVPTRVFFTTGAGVHVEERVSLQHAMQQAGIADCNLVKVSSVIAPGCRVIPREEGIRLLRPGQMVFAVIAKGQTNEPHRRLTAALGWAIPEKEGVPGYIAELEEEETFGKSDRTAGDEVGQMALRILGEKLRTRIDPRKVWERSRDTYRIGRTTVHAGCVTQTVIGDEQGLFASALVVAVYL